MVAVQNLRKGETYLLAFTNHVGENNYSVTLDLSEGFCAAARRRGYGIYGGGHAVAAEIIPEQNIPFAVAKDIMKEVSSAFGRGILFATDINARGQRISIVGRDVIPNLRKSVMFTAAP